MLANLFGPRYQYRVGDFVHLPGDTLIWEIRWRGYLLLGPPGQRRRVPVYWLGEVCWDCYYEDELLPLNQMPF